jgi:hypothetical protein
VFGESMMLLYYTYALPLSLRIGRGFYEDGIWAESGFIPYSQIGGLTWREEGQVTLVLMYRMRSLHDGWSSRRVSTAPYGGCCATKSPRMRFSFRRNRSISARTTNETMCN